MTVRMIMVSAMMMMLVPTSKMILFVLFWVSVLRNYHYGFVKITTSSTSTSIPTTTTTNYYFHDQQQQQQHEIDDILARAAAATTATMTTTTTTTTTNNNSNSKQPMKKDDDAYHHDQEDIMIPRPKQQKQQQPSSSSTFVVVTATTSEEQSQQQQQQHLPSNSNNINSNNDNDETGFGGISVSDGGDSRGIRLRRKWRRKMQKKTTMKKFPRCAINFFGLPRAFKSLVLPSIVRNVIVPNAQYNCDYYVHYYDQQSEQAGRSGTGGHIDPSEILLLQEQVELVHNGTATAATVEKNETRRQRQGLRIPTVAFIKDTEEEFWLKHNSTIHKIRTTRINNKNGKIRKGKSGLLYFPWKDPTYSYPTSTDNIIKMWHSIESVWNFMEETTAEQQQQDGAIKQHDRVAMMRSDVVYVTPINIWDKGGGNDDGQIDTDNNHVVIPGFGKYPVSDRMIYGPYQSVKIWSSQRFSKMDEYVLRRATSNRKGWGIHSEKFVKYALLSAIRDREEVGGGNNNNNSTTTKIVEHKTMCFFRARPDESVWITDCNRNSRPSVVKNLQIMGNITDVVETAIGQRRKCGAVTEFESIGGMQTLDCSSSNAVSVQQKLE